jgi:amidophosphoribosyltransferase
MTVSKPNGFDDHPKEECGLFGAFNVPKADRVIYRGLFALQHRGQEGGGIAVSDRRKVRSIKGHGLIGEVCAKPEAGQLKGDLGIGHVRYSTTGSTRIQNVQPLVVECADGIWAVAHNGNLVNADQLRRRYQEYGSIFASSTDSEVLVHLLADPRFMNGNGNGRVSGALSELQGAFCFLIMTRDCVMAARDAHGFRPLSIGKLDDGYVFASETCAFATTGAEYIRDVEPGELVIADATGLHSQKFVMKPSRQAQCVFEQVYFARPDSVVFGHNVHETRCQLGRLLAQEHPVDADVVCAIPDSGNSAALGFSRESGIPLDHGFIRNHYVGRTFIMPEPDERATSADLKLAILPEVIYGKRVVVVDDSIVRGTTMRRRVQGLRDCGVKEVHLRISCPPIAHPCHYGIDFPTKKELVANSGDIEVVREFMSADSIGYLSVESLMKPFSDQAGFCAACFTGEYPVDISGAKGKRSLESSMPLLNFES